MLVNMQLCQFSSPLGIGVPQECMSPRAEVNVSLLYYACTMVVHAHRTFEASSPESDGSRGRVCTRNDSMSSRK